MINLFNKLIARFGFQLVSTKPDMSLVKETLRFMNTFPESSLCDDDDFDNLYAGDITFVKDKTGKTYLLQSGTEDKYFCDYDGDPNAPFEKMYEETKFTAEQIAEKLND
jgi:hypothetical protein